MTCVAYHPRKGGATGATDGDESPYSLFASPDGKSKRPPSSAQRARLCKDDNALGWAGVARSRDNVLLRG
jgi:hypothetical protein